MSNCSPISSTAKRDGPALYAPAERALAKIRERSRSDGTGERKRPRLLALVQLPPPEHGASAVNRQVVNSSLLARFFEIQVVPIAMMADLGRIRRFELAKIGRSLQLYWSAARQLFGSARPDLVYISLSPSGWAFCRDLVLIALFRAAGVPHVFHLHGRGIIDAISRTPWLKSLYRFAFARAFVITLGGLLNREVEDFVPQERIFVVPNGVRDASAVPCGQRHAKDHALRAAGPPRILFLSNMLEEKGPFILLDALAQLAGRGLEFEAQFAGPWRGSLTQELFLKRVRESGLEGRVSHLGPLYDGAKVKAFAEADIFTLPTYYENEALPLVVIEAMMHGLPVVTTNIGALPEIVTEGESGHLVEPENSAALADALERLLLKPELQVRYGRAARKRYENELTDTHFEERLLEVLLRGVWST